MVSLLFLSLEDDMRTDRTQGASSSYEMVLATVYEYLVPYIRTNGVLLPIRTVCQYYSGYVTTPTYQRTFLTCLNESLQTIPVKKEQANGYVDSFLQYSSESKNQERTRII